MHSPSSSMETPSKSQKKFSVPVDSDHKATVFRLHALSSPHIRAFHLAWFSLFSCFFSTFAIPPLLPIIRQDLHLSQSDIGRAGFLTFVGSIISRLAMGPICDLIGPRIASASLALLTVPAILSALLISSPASFAVFRLLVGLSLANFVANQFWMSSMFSSRIVGLANGLSAGWAAAGAGVAQFVMPQIYSALSKSNIHNLAAWRLAFVFPAIFQTATAIMVLAFGQDLPDGKYVRAPKSADDESKESVMEIVIRGVMDYRGWILGLIYASCFGVEMTIDNIIAQYFFDRFGIELNKAGAIAASVGLTNFVSRPAGGMFSDAMGKRFGIRGRLWSLWAVMTVAGALCALLGRVNTVKTSIAVMCCFSFCVQASSGLTFGVVPFVSKRYVYHFF